MKLMRKESASYGYKPIATAMAIAGTQAFRFLIQRFLVITKEGVGMRQFGLSGCRFTKPAGGQQSFTRGGLKCLLEFSRTRPPSSPL